VRLDQLWGLVNASFPLHEYISARGAIMFMGNCGIFGNMFSGSWRADAATNGERVGMTGSGWRRNALGLKRLRILTANPFPSIR